VQHDEVIQPSHHTNMYSNTVCSRSALKQFGAGSSLRTIIDNLS